MMSAVNWGEVYDSTRRAKGPGVARKVLEAIAEVPLVISVLMMPARKAAVGRRSRASGNESAFPCAE
jgi:hypothetical protein